MPRHTKKVIKMNLFFLHLDPKQAAMYHCDKHVVKMILELVQMLYTAHRMLITENLPSDAYRSFNPQHPTVVWVRMCVENYTYTADVAFYLTKEYTKRYNKNHICEKHIFWLRENKPIFKQIPDSYSNNVTLVTNRQMEQLGMTPLPLAMPEDSKCSDPVTSYRLYYILHKNRFATWKTETPYWYSPIQLKLKF